MNRLPTHCFKFLVILMLLMLGTTGCWNRRELPSLAIVMGVAMDKPEDQKDSKQVKVTAQIVRTGAIKTGDKGGSNSKAYVNLTNSGDSLFAIIRGFTHETSRKLYWPHDQMIIFGRSLAESGIQQYLDFFVRDQEPRLGVWMLVADDQASDIFDVEPSLEKITAISLAHMLDAQAASSTSTAIKLNDFLVRLLSKTTAPIASIVKVVGQGSEKRLFLTGTAVFKGDKLVGELNEPETRGLLWVIDKVKSGIIDVAGPDGVGDVSLEIIRAKGKITPQIIDDQVHIKVEIEEEGNVGTQTCPNNLELPDAIKKLEEEKNAAIKGEIKAALKKAQKLNADIFGFGDAVHQKFPQEWKELEDNWDEIFPELDVELSVESKVRRLGSSKRAVMPDKENKD